MKKKLLKITGVAVVVFALVANVQYALVNYSFGSITPGTQLIAQTSTSGTNGTSSNGTDGTSTDGSGGKYTCGLDDCSKSRVIGVPPFEVTVTRNGHYQHCKISTSGSCNSGSCDVACDATFND